MSANSYFLTKEIQLQFLCIFITQGRNHQVTCIFLMMWKPPIKASHFLAMHFYQVVLQLKLVTVSHQMGCKHWFSSFHNHFRLVIPIKLCIPHTTWKECLQAWHWNLRHTAKMQGCKMMTVAPYLKSPTFAVCWCMHRLQRLAALKSVRKMWQRKLECFVLW